MPLPEPIRTAVLDVLKEAERQLNQEALDSWFGARANPEAWQSHRKGVEAMRLRCQALLTRAP
jgi:hypothetical protein